MWKEKINVAYTVMPMIVIRVALFHGCKWDNLYAMPDKCHVRLVIQ
jgi:hypothetical protein